MPDGQHLNPAPELAGPRDAVRRSLLRANTAVALVLLSVLVLASIATLASLRARQNQRRAEQARSEARAELWRAYLSDIRAIRQDKTLGRRPAALEVIRRATAIAPSLELRNEAVATLALPDFALEARLPADPAMVSYAFDQNLRRCALSLTNGDIVIRTVNGLKEVARLKMVDGPIPAEQEGPSLMEFSPNGARLSVRYRRGALAVWDWEKRQTTLRHDIDKARRVASRGRFSADGRFVVGPVFGPRDGTAVFAAETGQRVAFFPEIDSFRHVAVRPGAPMFAANDGTNVVVVNWETQQHVAELPYAAGVRALAWSPDGRRLAIAGNLLEVHVWDFEARQRQVLTGHKNDVWSVTFDPRGERVATASYDGTSRLWDLRDGRLLGVTSEGWVMQWRPEDRLVLEGFDRALEVRRLTTSPVHQELVGPANVSNARTMDLSADGAWAISTAGRYQLQVWNLTSDRGPDFLPTEWLRSLSFHPTEPRLMLARRSGLESRPYLTTTNTGTISLRLGEATPLPALPGKRLDLITMSADARTVAYVELGSGRVWAGPIDAVTPLPIREAAHNSVADNSSSPNGGGTVSLSPDGRWLACGVSARGAKAFDTQNGELIRQLGRNEASVQFSRDGRWLVAAERARCRAFRVQDWSEIWVLEYPRVEQPAAAFSPDGSLLAVTTSPRVVALLNAATGRELAQLQSPDPAPVITMRWSPDGSRLVFANRENHLEVWRPALLRNELAQLGLDWDSPASGLTTASPPGSVSAGLRGDVWMTAGIFSIVAVIAVIALLALHRHRRLTEAFGRTEAQAAQRERELHIEREVNQLKSSFVSMVSHEFRTPLGIINSSAQILERYFERLSAGDRIDHLRSIHKSVRRMSGLMEEVLVLSKVEAGQMAFQPTEMDLPTFVRKLTDEMHSATNRLCPISLAVGPLPPVRGDEALLRHIFTNLLSNAVKYSPPGREVEFMINADNSEAVFLVRDHGMGIPRPDHASLFKAFHRGRNAGRIPGTGLGLTIVKRCVELHGGRISFESEEGKGTTFTVVLPLFHGSAGQPCSGAPV